MRSTPTALKLFVVLATLAASAAPAHAQRPPAFAGDARSVARARELFIQGASLVKSAQWAEALGSFEQSSELRSHPITTYNIGACQRALGRYTLARSTFLRALAGDAAAGTQLPPSLRSEAQAYLAEIERFLVHVDLTIAPADAALAVDGRPLARLDSASGQLVMVAGLRAAGRGETLPSVRVEVVLDPGTHLLTLSRKGFSDQLVSKTFEPGVRPSLTLNLDRLPAKLRVSSNESRAVVRIDKLDVGYAPIEVDRPSGAYSVSVAKSGFVSYDSTVKVNPGEAADIKARLAPTPITQKWWFWSAVSVLATGAVVGTYFATRTEPAPTRPPLDGGGLGWAVEVQ